MASTAHCDMTSMQGMSDNREQGRPMDRDIRAPFNGMRGKRLQAEDYDIYSRVRLIARTYYFFISDVFRGKGIWWLDNKI